MGILEVFILLAGIGNVFLGFFVFSKAPHKKINRIFGIFSGVTALWILSNLMGSIQPHPFWVKMGYALGALIPFVALFWVLELCGKKFHKINLILIIGLLFSLSSFTNLVVANIKRVYLGGFEGETGPLFIPFWIYISGLLIFITYTLLSEYWRATGILKIQISYVIIGAILYIGTVLIASFILPLFGIKEFIPLDSPSSLFLLFFTTLAITKYHLFGIKVILTEILIGAMGLILLVLPLLMPTTSLKVLTFTIFFLFLIFGYFLIKATHEEEKRREEAEKMAVRERALRIKTEKLVRAREQFLLSSQHYFRTPLTSIIGFLEMILNESYGKLPEKAKEKLTLTFQSILELRKRVEESLDIGQFQLKKGILNLEEVQIEDLVKKSIEELKPQAEEKNLSLEFSFPKNSLPKIKLDKKRMFEVFTNLIDNAIKHTIKGGIEIYLKYENDKNSILFSVKDTGIGIPKEELAFIGQAPFERGKNAKELTPLGKGIGLYLSRLIVEAHGGKLWAESEGKGMGSTFYVELPIK
jgi:signal transduction histidine kinase